MIGFRSGPGGIGRIMTTLANHLTQIGINVDLILPPGNHPELEDVDPRIQRLFLTHEDHRSATRELRDYIHQQGPHAVLSNKDQSSRLILNSIEKECRPLLAMRIGTNVPEKMRRQNRLLAPWRCHKLAKLYSQADVLIGNSSGVSDSLRVMLKERANSPEVKTIFNPVNKLAIREMASETCNHAWVNDKPGPLIISAGRLVRAKNFPLLIEAFSNLPKELNARLIICGEGGQRSDLVKLADALRVSDRIDLVGYKPNPFPYIASADLFVCSSIFEGANNSLMEAVALGIPCISTDCPSGSRDILEHGKVGSLTPVNSIERLSSAMQDALTRPTDPEIMKKSAERFDPIKIAELYAKALRLTTNDNQTAQE